MTFLIAGYTCVIISIVCYFICKGDNWWLFAALAIVNFMINLVDTVLSLPNGAEKEDTLAWAKATQKLLDADPELAARIEKEGRELYEDMTRNYNNKIRERAYFLWEQAGRPISDGIEFWLKAERGY